MKRLFLLGAALGLGLLAAALIPASALAQTGPDTHYFGCANNQIFWQMDYDNPIPQEELAKVLAEKDLLTQIDASKPGVITAKLPMHPVRYDGAGIRPEHAEILLTAAQVSGDVVIRFGGEHYHATVQHMVLQMSRPSTQENISGTHPFEYHFGHQWGIIKNSMYNTYLAAALDFEFNRLFMAPDKRVHAQDSAAPSGEAGQSGRVPGVPVGQSGRVTGVPVGYGTVISTTTETPSGTSYYSTTTSGSSGSGYYSSASSGTSGNGYYSSAGSGTSGNGYYSSAGSGSASAGASRSTSASTTPRIALPQGATTFDLRTGQALNPRDAADADGFYGQWNCRLYESDQAISFVCFKPDAFQTQIVSAEREAADSTEALCRRYQAIAGINGSYFNMKELTSVTYLKDEGVVIFPDNQANQANGLVAVAGAQVRIVPCEGPEYNDEKVPEPDGMVSGPVLVEKGEIKAFEADTPDKQRFYMKRHPRSIIGQDARGAIWLIVVDGRAPGQGEGMSIIEAAALSWRLGLVDALNLDGGGSSTLWVAPAGVLNHPCDNHRFDPYGQRIVPNAILVQ